MVVLINDVSGVKPAAMKHRADHFNSGCLSRWSEVQDCQNGVSMELFLHFSLVPAVSGSVLRFQMLKSTIR